MGIISWVIFGAIAGWIASIILKTNDQQGALGNIIVGIIGAAVGGWLTGFLFDDVGISGFTIESFVVAIVGSIVFLLIKGAVTGKRSM